MYDSGFPRVTGRPASQPTATAAPEESRLKRTPILAASRSATRYPALCRLPAYRGPGLPSPAISQRSSAMRCHPQAGPAAGPGRTRPGPPQAGLSRPAPREEEAGSAGLLGSGCIRLGVRHRGRLALGRRSALLGLDTEPGLHLL